MTGDPMPAVLLQLSEHAQLLASLDQREAEHFRAARQRLGELAELITALGGTLQDQSAVLARLDELTGQIPRPAPADEDGGEARAYEPGPAPQWWKLAGDARDEALARLRAWVEQVYRPGYGQLAAARPALAAGLAVPAGHLAPVRPDEMPPDPFPPGTTFPWT